MPATPARRLRAPTGRSWRAGTKARPEFSGRKPGRGEVGRRQAQRSRQPRASGRDRTRGHGPMGLRLDFRCDAFLRQVLGRIGSDACFRKRGKPGRQDEGHWRRYDLGLGRQHHRQRLPRCDVGTGDGGEDGARLHRVTVKQMASGWRIVLDHAADRRGCKGQTTLEL